MNNIFKKSESTLVRFNSFVLLATVALIVSIGVTSANTDAQITQPRSIPSAHSFRFNQTMVQVRTNAKSEERIIAHRWTEKIASILKSGTSKLAQGAKIQTWLLKRKTTDDIFKTLELNTAGKKIFEDPKFITWVVYVTKVEKQNPEEIVLSKLMAQYTPYSLAKMIASAKKVSNTEGLAILLQAQQRRVWMDTGKSGDDVFKLLKLDKTGSKLFKRSRFTTWTSYVDEFNRNNPNEAVSLFSLLTKRYNEATLSEMIEAAKKVSSTESIATKLQSQQNKLWSSKKKSPDDVFKLLMLDKPNKAVLSDPKLRAFASYLKVFNLANPRKEATLLATLSHYYDDVNLGLLLQEGKKFPETKKIAEELQVAQFARWLKEGETFESLFKLLSRKKEGWIIYPDMAFLKSYGDFYTTMMKTTH
ncbi:hypothetical protein L916_11574 [Phytophthora nicotianae]|uniref:RxLR effector PexRD54 WY domain-containing protein n=1 Tax=Phytophthora nicotianae TaxID=4792 RepID=W2IQP5_PHYNI|nr:hypothetical protein L916_11574 [Phytophthora nicotianae]